jgi:hypothetical protein
MVMITSQTIRKMEAVLGLPFTPGPIYEAKGPLDLPGWPWDE